MRNEHKTHAQIKEDLAAKTHALGERVKELNCLYGISKLVDRPDVTPEDILQGTVDLIPVSWQYPEVTCARIQWRNRSFQTQPFQETRWRQSADIVRKGETEGRVEVFYVKAMPPMDEGPFLIEERRLVDAIAERLGKVMAGMEAEARNKQSEAQYRTLVESVMDGIAILQDETIQFVNPMFRSLFGCDNSDRPEGWDIVDLIAASHRERFFETRRGLENSLSGDAVCEIRCATRSGEIFWAEARLNRIQWNGGPAVSVMLKDITDRRQKEQELRRESDYLREQNIKLRMGMKERYRFGDIIGKSPGMQAVYELIIKAAETAAAVLIRGESGTGKELAAKAIHEQSRRGPREFVTVNCGAIPETILEREFFGHKKGAFTGADTDINGYIDLADEGTLFLDEVAELSLGMQVKLLRVLDNGYYNPIGDSRAKRSDFRVIAATNRDVTHMVNQGRIREDFFYRIDVIPIHIPPLRTRREDIPLLIDHYLEKFDCRHTRIRGKVMDIFSRYDWPGNVRELQNVLHRYITLNQLDLPGASIKGPEPRFRGAGAANADAADHRKGLEEVEKEIIADALKRNRWHRGKTAAMLNIPQRTLYRKIKKYRLNPA